MEECATFQMSNQMKIFARIDYVIDKRKRISYVWKFYSTLNGIIFH